MNAMKAAAEAAAGGGAGRNVPTGASSGVPVGQGSCGTRGAGAEFRTPVWEARELVDQAQAGLDGRVVGRQATDLIKTGGFKVGAGEGEAAILEHPSVAEVAVVGMPDDDLGERIVAFVVLRPDTEAEASALIDLVAEQLTPHKRPREVRFVEALPRNAMGKVVKPRLLSS